MKIETSSQLGIYIHWPYCQAKCPYCDFNSHVVKSVDSKVWKDAYLSELKRYSTETANHVVTSIFFGGGTPSLMPASLVGAVVNEIQKLWRLGNDLEITLEANPTSSEALKFIDFRSAGISRLSMGIQALNDVDLQRLGRLHTAAEAKAAFFMSREIFDRISFDLIYGRQEQSLSQWETELIEALSMSVDHLSLYQLTIEDGTAFGDRYAAGKLKGLPSDDLGAEMYELTQDITEQNGMPAYEISNHAKPGSESRHNLIYWRGLDYLGIGPGAHGRITLDNTRYATETNLAPAHWLRDVQKSANGEAKRTPLSSHDIQTEYLMMCLRLAEGVDLSRILDDTVRRDTITQLQRDGLVQVNEDRLTVPRQNRILLNAILRELLL